MTSLDGRPSARGSPTLGTMWAGAGGPPNPCLLARNAYVEMIKAAQNVADRYELSREEIDVFALRSHLHAAAARDSGRFAAEIRPVEVPADHRQPARTFEHDEIIRGDTTAEKLAALPPQPNTTQMTAGNSSPLSDGASVVVVASQKAAEELGIERLARVVVSATYALDPQLMGIAPAFAMAEALKRARLTPEDIAIWEVHEAFAAQALGVLRELPRQLNGFEVPDDRLNPNGGAVAIGHPFGSSGAWYVRTLPPSFTCARPGSQSSASASGPVKASPSCLKIRTPPEGAGRAQAPTPGAPPPTPPSGAGQVRSALGGEEPVGSRLISEKDRDDGQEIVGIEFEEVDVMSAIDTAMGLSLRILERRDV